MNKLGIYFGPQGISIVESNLKKPINNIIIPHSAVSTGGPLEDKVPEEVKIATLIKNGLINKKIDAKETTVILSGKDLIVRTFEMPILPREELLTAINFEAKKFIPFKIDELFSDSQWKFDKTSRKNFVLFVGIKKEILDNYLLIFEELNLTIKSIEYSAFSILRLLKLAKINEKGRIVVVDLDLIQNDEANFVVLENGFPLFSRDLTTVSEAKDEMGDIEEISSDPKVSQTPAILEKFKREILVSLNYYERKFLGKDISKIFFIVDPAFQQPLLDAFKDVKLNLQFIDVNKYTEEAIPFSLSFAKAFSGSLTEIRTDLKINLLLAKDKTVKETSAKMPKALFLMSLLKPSYTTLITCLLFCVIMYGLGVYRLAPLKKELADAISLRPKISAGSPESTNEELNIIYTRYKEKINTIENLLTKQKYLTTLLDSLPRLIPSGIWLESMMINNEEAKDKLGLTFVGIAYLEDSNKEMELVNNFLSNLKESPGFSQYFQEITIVSLDSSKGEKGILTNFTISCRN